MEEETSLGVTSEGADGIKSLSGICRSSALSFSLFSHHIWTHSAPQPLPPIFFFNLQVSFSSRPHSQSTPESFMPSFFFCVRVLYLSSARSFHFCLSIFSQGESLACDLYQCSQDCATLPREWESNTDSGAACQEDGTTPEPMATENIQYMSASSYSHGILFPSVEN